MPQLLQSVWQPNLKRSLLLQQQNTRIRTVLVCHADSHLNREGIARWLASFSDLAGMVLIEETSRDLMARVKREMRRSGVLRFFDVVAFRLYYRAFKARRDADWERAQLQTLASHYAVVPATTEILFTDDPNSDEVEAFLRRLQPDLTLARCKRLLKERIFGVPRVGTFVLHPGICPEYRNAHGAFWAIVNDDSDRVGLTLLRIDRGVDTGPVYGYYSYAHDARRESHIVIMKRMVLENLDAIRDKLLEVCAGRATPIDTSGRKSAAWGQPWLSKHLRWMWRTAVAR
jgi:hypothetical protein